MAYQNTHTPVRYPAWQRQYEAAILELDSRKRPALIQNALVAVTRRLEYLGGRDCGAERDAIANAIMFLQLLERAVLHDEDLFQRRAS